VDNPRYHPKSTYICSRESLIDAIWPKNIVDTRLLPFRQSYFINTNFNLCFRVNLGFCLAYI
jgi:hypothetical protein